MNKLVELLEDLKLVERQPVIRVPEHDIRELHRSAEANQILAEMDQTIVAAGVLVDQAPRMM